ncbi:MAG: hypothetical protein A2566_01830 [Candidatus Zambryskibacteria bacterium RIFOXYD1_FULL_40_13]|nr:MAG: hypothetical protein UT25_C0001G0059 [Parcubacteria group bacterium GW2011_GWC1_39_12]KKR19583.1 MAG: hypothetical protein UT49_C0001G0059 [Parcubacteria group bacterium GW2011_GWF1_39_37]KKR35737.1 MAG: hypothetical protein UT68_C0001G0060 [Parcubacteria group bacterium GW2011_GWC2_40_10]KKR52551.1 MAG: hypothetical protein UT89_C0001G0059 [Parcubacteria group bacterium GW2011_GWE1_40_20]KKR65119.1 MAG: hypothetical protein UU06_C0028G0007 [Parcubacteria group bacterium GW2011_GWB1_40_
MRAFTACIVVLLLALVVLLAVANAQPSSMVPGYEADLVKLAPLQDNGLVLGCGEYFRYIDARRGPNEKGMLIFVASSVRNGMKMVTTPALGINKFQVLLVKGLAVPRMKVLRPKGPVFPWVEIQISPADYQRAPCLSHVAIVGGISAH